MVFFLQISVTAAVVVRWYLTRYLDGNLQYFLPLTYGAKNVRDRWLERERERAEFPGSLTTLQPPQKRDIPVFPHSPPSPIPGYGLQSQEERVRNRAEMMDHTRAQESSSIVLVRQ